MSSLHLQNIQNNQPVPLQQQSSKCGQWVKIAAAVGALALLAFGMCAFMRVGLCAQLPNSQAFALASTLTSVVILVAVIWKEMFHKHSGSSQFPASHYQDTHSQLVEVRGSQSQQQLALSNQQGSRQPQKSRRLGFLNKNFFDEQKAFDDAAQILFMLCKNQRPPANDAQCGAILKKYLERSIKNGRQLLDAFDTQDALAVSPTVEQFTILIIPYVVYNYCRHGWEEDYFLDTSFEKFSTLRGGTFSRYTEIMKKYCDAIINHGGNILRPDGLRDIECAFLNYTLNNDIFYPCGGEILSIFRRVESKYPSTSSHTQAKIENAPLIEEIE